MNWWNDEQGNEGGTVPRRGMWRDYIDELGLNGRAVLRRDGTSVDEIATLVGDGCRLRRLCTRYRTLTEQEVRACLDFALDRRATEILRGPAPEAGRHRDERATSIAARRRSLRDPAGAVARAEAATTRIRHDQIVSELMEAEAEALLPDENDP